MLSFLLIVKSSKGQPIESLVGNPMPQRYFQINQFKERFKKVPSLIGLSNLHPYSLGSLNGYYSDGTLKSLQSYGNLEGLSLGIESLAPLENTNWVFYGELDYYNTQKKQVEANLSYFTQPFGSPYYFFQAVEGLWGHQYYKLAVDASNQVSDKISLGFHLQYNTDFLYRKNDTRNETVSLRIPIKLGISYQLLPTHTVSLAVGMEFAKADIMLNNRYTFSGQDDNYRIYFNTGMGSFLNGIDTGAETKRKTPELQLHYLIRGKSFDLSAQSMTRIGKENWVDKNVYRVDQPNEISSFNVINQELRFQSNIYFSRNYLALIASTNYVSGEGSYFNRVISRFQKNYNNHIFSYELKALLFYNKGLINQIGLGLSSYNHERTDTNYAYQLDNRYIKPEVFLGINKPILNRFDCFGMINTGIKYPMKVKHDPFAASNIYVELIGIPLANYMENRILDSKIIFGFNHGLKENGLVEYTWHTNYQRAINAADEFSNAKFLEFIFNVRFYF